MKLLLDTHVAIWLVNEREQLSSKAKSMLLDENHTLYLSMASVWEMTIKISLAKLRSFNGGTRSFLAKAEDLPIALLPITQPHLEVLETLPFIHRDPFDRLLVAIAKADGMTILTADANIQKYDVPFVW
jgi:PIN domain nuclease of toxin-antitoxin system